MNVHERMHITNETTVNITGSKQCGNQLAMPINGRLRNPTTGPHDIMSVDAIGERHLRLTANWPSFLAYPLSLLAAPLVQRDCDCACDPLSRVRPRADYDKGSVQRHPPRRTNVC